MNIFYYINPLLFNRMSTSISSLAKRISEIEKKVDGLAARLPEPEKPSRFIDNKDGTVTDKETNLTWMKQDDGKRRKWEEAKKYCEGNQAKLPGEGWRLPTVKELISIVDYDKYGPAIDPIFTETQTSYYWSSTPYAGASGYAWIVFFGDGDVYWVGMDGGYHVRPVRQNS